MIPALDAIGLGGIAAVNLIVGTALVESDLRYVKQITGPAVGICQIEPATYNDLRTRFSLKHGDILEKVLKFLNMSMLPFKPDYLMGNMSASVIIARIKYYMHPDPLPSANDWHALSAYHKKIYNTPLGATDITVSQKIFRSVVNGYVHHKTL